MRDLVRLTYASANEPVFVDPEEVVAIHPHPTLAMKSVVVLENGCQISVDGSSEQCFARLKQRNTPAKQNTKRRPKLSRGVQNVGEER